MVDTVENPGLKQWPWSLEASCPHGLFLGSGKENHRKITLRETAMKNEWAQSAKLIVLDLRSIGPKP